MKSLGNEGIHFSDILIDRLFLQIMRQPVNRALACLPIILIMLQYDIANSIVIGDRITDVQLAKNLGCKAIWINNDPNLGSAEIKDARAELEQVIALETTSWKDIYEFLKLGIRRVHHQRNTNETKISIELNLDGSGKADIHTGLGFFDHMLEQIARHGKMDLTITTKGDLHIDEHHTIEDTGIALGEAFAKALDQ